MPSPSSSSFSSSPSHAIRVLKALRVTMKTITTTIANKHAKRKVEDDVAKRREREERERE